MCSFTNVGYLSEDDFLTLARPVGDHDSPIHYKESRVYVDDVNIVKHLDDKSIKTQEEWHLDQALDIVYNIIRGQRKIVQQYTNAFVDRYPKTFFSDSYRFRIDHKQENVIMSIAIANYYNHQRWTSGVIEDIYDAYCLIKASYAKALLHAIKAGWLDPSERGEAVEGDIPDNKRAYSKFAYVPSDRYISIPNGDDEIRDIVANTVTNFDEACALIEGAFLCAFMYDHTTNGQPMKTSRERKHYDMAGSVSRSIDPDDYHSFYKKESLESLIRLGRNIDALMVIPAGENITIDALNETPAEWRKRNGLVRPSIKKDTAPVYVSYNEAYKMSDEEKKAVGPKKRGRRKKSSAIEEEINKLSEVDTLTIEGIAPHKL